MRAAARCFGILVALLTAAACGHSSGRTAQETTTTSTTSTTAVAPETSTSTSTTVKLLAAQLTPFVGDWHFHGVFAHIGSDGKGDASWRIYKWCSDDPNPPCDGVDGNNIIDGGEATFTVVAVDGTSATATVDRSTDTKTVPTGPVALRIIAGDHLDFPRFGVPLCGASSPPDSCGA